MEKNVFVVLGLGVLGLSCGLKSNSNDAANTAPTTAIADSIDLIGSKLQGAAMISAVETSQSRKMLDVGFGFLNRILGIESGHALELESVWAQENAVAGLKSGANTSLQTYLQDALNPDFENDNGANITVFGRFQNAVQILCALDFIVPERDTDNLPVVGVYRRQLSLNADSAIARRCSGFSPDSERTYDFTIEVARPSESNLYTRALSILMPGMESPSRFYIQSNDSVVRIATLELSSRRNQGSRALAVYDKMNDVLRFEYLSQSFGSTGANEWHRIYVDGSADRAYVLSHNGASDLAENPRHVRFAAASSAKASSRTTVAVSVGYFGQSLDSGGDVHDRNACLSASGGWVVTDNSLDCGIEGLSESAVTGVGASFSGHASLADLRISEQIEVPFSTPEIMMTAASE